MKFLDRLSDAYYKGEPLVSNEVFDELCKQYGYEGLGTSKETEVEHAYRMWSLPKVYPGEKLPFEGGIATPKLDGAAVCLTYYRGKFIRGATRGDGFRGQDITDKMATLVPLVIETEQQEIVQITGEVVTKLGKSNLRNYASGALNLKDLEEFKKRDLYFFAYSITPEIANNYNDTLINLERLGFRSVRNAANDNLLTCTHKGEGVWPTDGVVYRINENDGYNAAGFTSRHPKGAYAAKENKEGVRTTLLDIEWNVGRSGVVAPVAILDGADVDGARVSRATLHNWRYIEELGLEPGCTVEIIRAGEIIPRVVRKV